MKDPSRGVESLFIFTEIALVVAYLFFTEYGDIGFLPANILDQNKTKDEKMDSK